MDCVLQAVKTMTRLLQWRKIGEGVSKEGYIFTEQAGVGAQGFQGVPCAGAGTGTPDVRAGAGAGAPGAGPGTAT